MEDDFAMVVHYASPVLVAAFAAARLGDRTLTRDLLEMERTQA